MNTNNAFSMEPGIVEIRQWTKAYKVACKMQDAANNNYSYNHYGDKKKEALVHIKEALHGMVKKLAGEMDVNDMIDYRNTLEIVETKLF